MSTVPLAKSSLTVVGRAVLPDVRLDLLGAEHNVDDLRVDGEGVQVRLGWHAYW